MTIECVVKKNRQETLNKWKSLPDSAATKFSLPFSTCNKKAVILSGEVFQYMRICGGSHNDYPAPELP